MIQDALDALPETEDSDFKSNISLNELRGNGDQSSSSGNQQGVSQVDLALCLLADDEFLASQKNWANANLFPDKWQLMWYFLWTFVSKRL